VNARGCAASAPHFAPSLPAPYQPSALSNELRRSWIRDKNRKALQCWKPLHGPIDVRFESIATLIDMKTKAGRQQDLVDIEHLRMRVDGYDGS
jgi:hypothetical protein